MNTNTNDVRNDDADERRSARFEAWAHLSDGASRVIIVRRALRASDGRTAVGLRALLGKVARELAAARDAVDDAPTVSPAAHPEIARRARARVAVAHAALAVILDASGTDAKSEVLAHAARVLDDALGSVEEAQAALEKWSDALAGAPVEEGLAS